MSNVERLPGVHGRQAEVQKKQTGPGLGRRGHTLLADGGDHQNYGAH